MRSALLRFVRQNAIALVALFVALGGTAYAAGYPPNIIGTLQLKNGSVTSAKISNDTIRGIDVLESSFAKVPKAANADLANNAINAAKAATAAQADNATNLAGKPASAYVGSCLPGSVALGASWYAPGMTTTAPVAPNRFGGESGFTCSGGTPMLARLSAGFFRMTISGAALPTNRSYVAIANPDSRSATPLYVQANSFLAGPTWDIHTYDKTGAPADPYYLEVIVTAIS
jgi:hypothetical protein